MQVLARRALTLVQSQLRELKKTAVKKSAASAASLDSVKFQAVIKSAASAGSPKAKSGNQIRESKIRGAPGQRGSVGRRGRPGHGSDSGDGSGRSPDLGFPDLIP